MTIENPNTRQMQQSRFSLADTLNLLACLVFGFVCFLGYQFKTLGDTEWSVMLSLMITLLLFLPAYLARRLKLIRRNFRTGLFTEAILLFLFVAVAFYAIRPFSHYWKVTRIKAKIQAEIQRNVAITTDMFTDYEKHVQDRVKMYETQLNNASFQNKTGSPRQYNALGFVPNSVTDSEQIQTMLNVLNSKLSPATYEPMKKAAIAWLNNSSSIISHWKPIGIVQVIQQIHTNADQWKTQLEGYENYEAQGENPTHWTFSLSFNSVAQYFIAPTGNAPIVLPFAITLYAFMVLSYFVTKRDSRFPGCRQLFLKSEDEINEL